MGELNYRHLFESTESRKECIDCLLGCLRGIATLPWSSLQKAQSMQVALDAFADVLKDRTENNPSDHLASQREFRIYYCESCRQNVWVNKEVKVSYCPTCAGEVRSQYIECSTSVQKFKNLEGEKR